MAGSIPDRKSLREIGSFRGKAIQKAYEETRTTLVSIQGLTEEAVKDLLPPYAKIGLVNAPTLIAVGLPEDQVEELQKYAKRAGARRVTPLSTRGAFHVDMYMGRTAEEMGRFLRPYDFADITKGVFVANSDGRPLRAGKDVREELIQSMLVPVRYPNMLHTMANVGGFIEIGPGSRLNVLNKIPKTYTNHIKDYF